MMSSSANHRAGKPCCLMVDFFVMGVLDYRWKSLYPDWTSYDPVSLLTFPGRIWNNLSIYTNWGLLPTFITGKFAVFLWLVFFLFEAIFYVQISLFKIWVAPIFLYITTDMLFVSIYWYIILVETFQKRLKMTEFQKPFWLINIHTEVTHEKTMNNLQIKGRECQCPVDRLWAPHKSLSNNHSPSRGDVMHLGPAWHKKPRSKQGTWGWPGVAVSTFRRVQFPEWPNTVTLRHATPAHSKRK